ncbi:MAG: Hint domain-containing protein [Rhodospirillales bacterium]|nr:Hint domain-containing protein [Rhodospirillales bacterium]
MASYPVIFSAYHGSNDSGLWITDGTSAGTWELAVPGVAYDMNASAFTPLLGRLLFAGMGTQGGQSLWVTDGTGAGTTEILTPAMLPPAQSGFRPADLTPYNGKIILSGFNAAWLDGLWVSDGTAAGTSEIPVAGANTTPGGGLSPQELTPLNGKLVFDGVDSVGNQLWITDGTSAGTHVVPVSGQDAAGLAPHGFTVLGNLVLFGGYSSETGNPYRLWASDGTSAGTTMLASGSAAALIDPGNLTIFGNKALLTSSLLTIHMLWVTDGTPSGTVPLSVANTNSSTFNPGDLTPLGGHVLFAATDAGGLGGLWSSDGTSAGTTELAVAGASATIGVSAWYITPFAGGTKAVFEGVDAGNQYSLWVTDGTAAGTQELVVPGLAMALTSAQFPGYLVPGPNFYAMGNQVYFSVPDPFTSRDLWITDGTVAGTREIAPAGVGIGGLNPMTFGAFCYAAGTRIGTPSGDIAIEDLHPGDAVLRARGGTARVRWIGRRHVDCRRHPRPWDILPVRITAGAFGRGLPVRDLVLSPDHAVFTGGVLIPVRYLLNGATIIQQKAAAIDYLHLELDAHDVILAEGLPAESYLDTGNRGAFANGGAAIQLHPEFARDVWAREGCAPLVLDGPRLVAARRRLLAEAAALGHGLTIEPALRVFADGVRLTPGADGRSWRLPAAARTVRLRSRRWTPAHTRPGEADTRTLGVAVAKLTLDGVAIPLTDPRLSSGWHDPEADWRWTTGDAGLALAGVREIAFDVVMTGTYWTGGPVRPASRAATPARPLRR